MLRRDRDGAGIALVVAGAEPIYRERFPAAVALGAFSARGIRAKRFFRGVVLGYALDAFFFAYQVVFYVVAAARRLGAGRHTYGDMLKTAFPWATVLFIGFLPAVTEEGSAVCSRSRFWTGSAPGASSPS